METANRATPASTATITPTRNSTAAVSPLEAGESGSPKQTAQAPANRGTINSAAATSAGCSRAAWRRIIVTSVAGLPARTAR